VDENASLPPPQDGGEEMRQSFHQKKKGGVQNRVNYHLKGEEMKGEYNRMRLLRRYAIRNVKSVFGIKTNTIIYANM
jgi:hypothetical protein